MPIPLHRGTNISHWLSQSDRRGDDRAAWFTQQDVQFLADLGLDHVRIPIDECQLWDDLERPLNDGFDLLESALDWAEGAGLAVVVDLHILKNHFFNQSNEPALFTDPEAANKFVRLWGQLSSRFGRRRTDAVAYELLNEPVATHSSDWNRVASAAIAEIRSREANRTIVLGSNRWCSTKTLSELEVPDDDNLILTFHFYYPMLITHHQAWWCAEGTMYNGPIQYPGSPIAPENLDKVVMPGEQRFGALSLATLNKPFSRADIDAEINLAVEASRRTGRPLYCGEFGVINLAPPEVRKRWFSDVVAAFEEHNIGWCCWDYRGDFGIADLPRRSVGLIESALKKRSGLQRSAITSAFEAAK
jgi:endoglucanase